DRGLDAGPGAARGGRPAPPPGPAAAPAAGPDHAVLPAAAARDAAAPPGGRPVGHRLPAGTRPLAGDDPMTAPANGRRGAAPRAEATAGGPPRPEDGGEPGTEQLSASRGVAGVERVPRAAVYNRFWHSMGGGERHSGMIAQVLSADGVEVDLLGHSEAGRDELAGRLGVDPAPGTLRVIPDRGDTEIARLSGEYDLFVNSTYMSRLEPRSAHSAYLCFFPTPFDHDLARWRKLAIRTLGRYLKPAAGYLFFQFGTGWFPP